MELSSHFI